MDFTRLDTNLFRLSASLLEATRTLLPRLAVQVQATHPDFIIHDSLTPWGRGVAALLGLPSACSVTTFAMNNWVVAGEPTQLLNLLRMAPAALHRLPAALAARQILQREMGLPIPDILSVFSNPAPLNLVYTSRAIQPGARHFGPNWHFVGATIGADRLHEVWPPTGEESSVAGGGRPLVYISLGTLFNEAPAFFRLCLEAFGGAPFDVLLSVGEKVDLAALGEPPANVRVERFVPQIGVLKRATLFVTHAGLNSVHEALLLGVPMVVLPQAADQEWVAQQMRRLGAAHLLRANRLTAPSLRAAVERAMAAPSIKLCAGELGETLRAAGGPVAAADALEVELARRRASRTRPPTAPRRLTRATIHRFP
jgi:MGT family glycosyltransferase